MNYDHWRHSLRAMLMQWLGRHASALAAYQDAHRADPRHVETMRAIAWLLAQQQHWREAEIWLERALAQAPGGADTWFNLGYVREQAGERARAVEALRRAAELNPKLDQAWYGLGMNLAHLGEHAAAAEALRHAAGLQPMFGRVWYALGMAYHHCNQPERVTEVVHHLLTHEPQTARRLVRDTERTDLLPLVADLDMPGTA